MKLMCTRCESNNKNFIDSGGYNDAFCTQKRRVCKTAQSARLGRDSKRYNIV